MDRLVLNTLDDKENTHTFPFLRSAAMQVNECSVTFRSLFSSPCCPLHHTGQDYLPLGRLDSGEESQRSSSTRLLCSCRGGNKRNNTHIIHTCNIVSYLQMTNIQGKNFFYYKDWPGELQEGAERHHGSHTLTRWCKRCVEQNVTDAGYMHHAVVVQVGWEWHPRVPARHGQFVYSI